MRLRATRLSAIAQGTRPKAASWTPAQISTALWLDAEATSTIILNGSTVSQWSDRSGNNRHATQGVAVDQPTYSATGFNSKPTIQFDGTNDTLLANSAGAAIGSQPFTLLAAMRFPTSASLGQFILSLRETSGTVTRGYVRRPVANTFNSQWGPGASPPDITVADGTNNILGVQRRTGNVVENFANGVAGGSTTTTFGAAFATFAIGSFGATSWTDVWFSEMVVTTGTMTTTDRQKVEGYLAWKWGLTANLPVDHPYKNTPPTA